MENKLYLQMDCSSDSIENANDTVQNRMNFEYEISLDDLVDLSVDDLDSSGFVRFNISKDGLDTSADDLDSSGFIRFNISKDGLDTSMDDSIKDISNDNLLDFSNDNSFDLSRDVSGFQTFNISNDGLDNLSDGSIGSISDKYYKSITNISNDDLVDCKYKSIDITQDSITDNRLLDLSQSRISYGAEVGLLDIYF